MCTRTPSTEDCVSGNGRGLCNELSKPRNTLTAAACGPIGFRVRPSSCSGEHWRYVEHRASLQLTSRAWRRETTLPTRSTLQHGDASARNSKPHFQSDPDQRELRPSPTHGAQTRQVANHEPLPTHRGRTCPQAFERPQQSCSTKSRRSSPSHNVEQMAHSKTLSTRGSLLSSLLSASPRLH